MGALQVVQDVHLKSSELWINLIRHVRRRHLRYLKRLTVKTSACQKWNANKSVQKKNCCDLTEFLSDSRILKTCPLSHVRLTPYHTAPGEPKHVRLFNQERHATVGYSIRDASALNLTEQTCKGTLNA